MYTTKGIAKEAGGSIRNRFVLGILCLSTFGFPNTLAQSGGQFVMETSVIAGGGGRSTGGAYSLLGTIGQAASGVSSAGGPYALNGGFWGVGGVETSLITVSGQVFTAGGLGLRNAIVSLTDQFGVRRNVMTSTLGFYSFADVEAGKTYTLSVSSKRYRFQSQSISSGSDLNNVNFVGLE